MPIYVYFIPVFVILIAFRLFKPNLIGLIGEINIGLRLSLIANESDVLINNVLLMYNGHTSQIDHLLISEHGIFVIETKNYSGWIYGNEKDELWTSVVFNNKYRFHNPVKQNWSHIKMLKEIFKDYTNVNYNSIIVFTNRARLKSISSNVPVIYENELKDIIDKQKVVKNITEEQVADMVMRLNNFSIQGRTAKALHVKSIKTTLENKELLESKDICPKCGLRLIERSGKYGRFLGCSGYPRCKFTKKL